jgi:predicted NodU family carbamoyl transferase
MLNDGYYLSTYTCVDPISNVFKSMIRHDHNISLWLKNDKNIELVHHWELERVSGIKHHQVSFFSPDDFIEYTNKLLSKYSLNINCMEGIIGTPIVSSKNDYYNEDMGKEYTYHAIAHIFSSILMDSDLFFNNNILAFCLDGGADVLLDRNMKYKHNYMGVFSSKGLIEHFPVHSPGLYWEEAKNIFKYEEGTLMALATASKSKSLEKLYETEEVIKVDYDIDVLAMKLFINKIVKRVFAYTQNDIGKKLNIYDSRFNEYDNKVSMVIKIIQEISLCIMDDIIQLAIERFNINASETYLGMSGGYALNCPTNTYIQNKYKFKGQLIPPCTNDGGQAIGMGLYYFYKHMKHFNFRFKNAYYGDEDKNLEIILHDNKYKDYIDNVVYDLKYFTEDIISNPIIWFSGRSEVGPRALGNRSILADPRNLRSKDLLNVYKNRQWWRPVAPIVLEEELHNWFENAFQSPYMLNNFILKQDKASLVPAIEHLDHTCRVQTVNKEDNPLLYFVIKQFYIKTGVPILINTSLNDKGEPIVNNILETVNFALRKNVKIAYINRTRINFNDNLYTIDFPLPRDDYIFSKYSNEDIIKFNPYKIEKKEYNYYVYHLGHLNLSLSNKTDVDYIKEEYTNHAEDLKEAQT